MTHREASATPDQPPAAPPAHGDIPPTEPIDPTAPPGPPPTPITEADRYQSLDVLRGFAVLGILAMNIMAFSGPFAGYTNPTIWPLPYEGGNRIIYWVQHLVFDMKMMSLFSMLFGAGVIIWDRKAASKADTPRLRWLWLRRMFWLFVIGMAHAWLLWEGDILVAYALTGAIAAWWLRRLPVWGLLLAGAAFFFVHLALSFSQYFSVWMAFGDHGDGTPFNMPREDFEAMREGMKSFMAPTPEMVQENIAQHRGSWMDVFEARAEANAFIQIQGFLFFIFWRAASMMLLGMALVKMGVFTAQRSAGFYAAMALVCYAIGVPMVAFAIIDNEAHAFDLMRAALVGTQLNVVGSVPIALGHAAVLLLLVKSGAVAGVRAVLAATGRMAFTNYLAQTLICTLIFYGYGLGQYGAMNRPALIAIVVGIWALQLTWSPLWLRAFRFGPAEWAWRSLTYWKAQPFRR
ncbi:MAG: DUF418 domain-containing protein [Phycisphaerales bacterium]